MRKLFEIIIALIVSISISYVSYQLCKTIIDKDWLFMASFLLGAVCAYANILVLEYLPERR